MEQLKGCKTWEVAYTCRYATGHGIPKSVIRITYPLVYLQVAIRNLPRSTIFSCSFVSLLFCCFDPYSPFICNHYSVDWKATLKYSSCKWWKQNMCMLYRPASVVDEVKGTTLRQNDLCMCSQVYCSTSKPFSVITQECQMCTFHINHWSNYLLWKGTRIQLNDVITFTNS